MNEANTKEANANPKAGADVKRGLDLPFFATPGILNGMTEQSLARAKENYEKLNAASGAINDVLGEAYSTNARGIADYTAKVIEFSGANTTSAFDFLTPSPGHEIAFGNPAALRHARPQELRSHDRAKPGALGARPQGRDRDCRANQEEFCQRAAEGVLVLIRTFAAPPGSAGTSAPREKGALQPMASRHAADTKIQQEEQDGRRHDQMPRDGARYPDRHESGSGKVSMQSGIFRAHLLLDLRSQPRMVCQGGLGSRAGRETA